MRDRAGRRVTLLPRGVRGVAALLTLGLCALLATVPGSSASFTATVVNTTDTVGTNTYFTCQSAAVGGAAYFAFPLDDATPTNLASARDVSGNSRPGTYQTAATHSTSNACARDTGGSTTFNGTSNYVSTATLQVNPQVFTIETWFRTSTARGALMGFSDVLALTPNSWDRMLYLNTSGKLVFAVYPNAIVTVTSPNSYTDGVWHHVVGTLGSSGMVLYVDGVAVASGTNTAAQIYNGYWKVGYNNLTSWPGVGTNFYFSGQLAFSAVYYTQLSATAVAAHYRAGL